MESNTFTLWNKWYLDISGYYMSSALGGNIHFDNMWQINAAIKHSFFSTTSDRIAKLERYLQLQGSNNNRQER